ncbi:MAG: deaminase [Desulfomicrobium escambiense]|nr:deaminase [Desulfomicrobium escambiense]
MHGSRELHGGRPWKRHAPQARQDEVPVGAVLVSRCRGDPGERPTTRRSATATPRPTPRSWRCARRARKLKNYRLLNTTLYVTIEPCVMCMGALVHARVARLVFGAADPKWGAAGSLYNLARRPRG